MAIFDKCVLASDVDGTLLDSGYVSPRNLEAIDIFRKNGGTFVISTGRSVSAMGPVFKLVDKAMVGPSVVLNGGMIYDFSRDKIIYEKVIDDSVKYISDVIRQKYPYIGIEIHSGPNTYVLNATPETEFHEDYELLDREYVTLEDIQDKPWNKVLYTCNTVKKRDEFLSWLNCLGCEECDFVPTGLNAGGGHHPYVEQMPKGVTKAGGLARLSKMLGIKKGGFFAIGDYYNDVEMLTSADVSSTPGDAPQDVKQFADFVGGRCRDGAVADFIEYLTKTGGKKNGRY